MKRIILTLLVSSLWLNIHAQSYTFSKTTGTYNHLSGSTSLTNGLMWDDPEFTIPIGFDVKIYGTTTNTLFTSIYWFGSGLNGKDSTVSPLMLPFNVDLVDRGFDDLLGEGSAGGLSNVSYLTTGSTGSRIFKLEFRNVGFYGDYSDDDTCQDSANFQIWMYEGSNDIEYRYGTSGIADLDVAFEFETGPGVGIWRFYDYNNDLFIGKGIALTGNASNPTSVSDGAATVPNLNGMIPDGTIYKFQYSNVSLVQDIPFLETQIKLSPIPAKSFLKIETTLNYDNQVMIVDAAGKSISAIVVEGKLGISDLPVGVYQLQLPVNSQIIQKRFVKYN